MASTPSATESYFVTSVTYRRKRIFQVDATATMFLDKLQHYRREGFYKLHAFVAMPDHIHLLITPIDITIERAVGKIKGGFSKEVGSAFPVWQKSFDSRRMRDAEEFIARKKYIHENPVRAHMVQYAEDYAYSSAFRTRTAAAEAAEC